VGDWGAGVGTLAVYVDDMQSPVLVTPLDLGSTLQLDDGRAYVGFTGATGDNHWQVRALPTIVEALVCLSLSHRPPLFLCVSQNRRMTC
jgi:hypothetical protein